MVSGAKFVTRKSGFLNFSLIKLTLQDEFSITKSFLLILKLGRRHWIVAWNRNVANSGPWNNFSKVMLKYDSKKEIIVMIN